MHRCVQYHLCLGPCFGSDLCGCVNVDGLTSASPSNTIHPSTGLEWLGTERVLKRNFLQRSVRKQPAVIKFQDREHEQSGRT